MENKTQNSKTNNNVIEMICKSDDPYVIIKLIIIDIINTYFDNNPALNENDGEIVKSYTDLMIGSNKLLKDFCKTLEDTKDLDKQYDCEYTKHNVGRAVKMVSGLIENDAECLKELFCFFVNKLADKHTIATLSKH